jgi:hypothetical protein
MGGTIGGVPPTTSPDVALPRALKDILAGLTFVALGLAFAVLASGYAVGTPVRMGPGFFPLALGGLLALIGGIIVVKGVLAGEGEAIGAVPWRALGLIFGAVLFFGLTVRGLGLVPSTFFAALMATFASRRTSVVAAVLITIGLTVLCVLIFVLALRLRLPLIGPWIPV